MTTAATGPGGHMAMRSHDTEESDAEEDEFGMKIRERAGKFLRIYCIVIRRVLVFITMSVQYPIIQIIHV